ARKRRREEWKRRREEERFFRKEQKRLEAEKAKAALSAPETAGEENFKVVAQEDIGSFEKKAEKKEKDVSNETPVVEEKSNEPSKKGWWNRLVK
ncbi:MAG: hypothetical protein LBU87_04810, partial [Lactobacillales bacterium]|nr:hypothetical protein [Lactobacillales bacterium]